VSYLQVPGKRTGSQSNQDRKQFSVAHVKKLFSFLFLNKKRSFKPFNFPNVFINKNRWPQLFQYAAKSNGIL